MKVRYRQSRNPKISEILSGMEDLGSKDPKKEVIFSVQASTENDINEAPKSPTDQQDIEAPIQPN